MQPHVPLLLQCRIFTAAPLLVCGLLPTREVALRCNYCYLKRPVMER